jgi:transcription elongation factor GreA
MELLEGRILEIAGVLENSQVVSHRKSSTIRLGSKVKVKTEDGKVLEYSIVTSPESDPLNLKISDESPIGQALLNHKPGQKVSYQTPTATHKLEIVSFQ